MPTKAAASDVKEPLGDGVKKEERKEEARDVAGFLLSLKTGDTSPKPDDDTDEDDSPPDEKNVEKGKTVALDESTPENVAETEDSPYQEIGQEILKKDIEEAVNSAAEETVSVHVILGKSTTSESTQQGISMISAAATPRAIRTGNRRVCRNRIGRCDHGVGGEKSPTRAGPKCTTCNHSTSSARRRNNSCRNQRRRPHCSRRVSATIAINSSA
jgi:hypothetical protein